MFNNRFFILSVDTCNYNYTRSKIFYWYLCFLVIALSLLTRGEGSTKHPVLQKLIYVSRDDKDFISHMIAMQNTLEWSISNIQRVLPILIIPEWEEKGKLLLTIHCNIILHYWGICVLLLPYYLHSYNYWKNVIVRQHCFTGLRLSRPPQWSH